MQFASEHMVPQVKLQYQFSILYFINLCSYIIQNWYNVLNTMDILFLTKKIYMLDRKNKKCRQNRLLTYPTKI